MLKLVRSGRRVVLVSQGLDHVMRPLAQHLGVKWILANRLEFRDGIATGRLLDPVIRPRGIFARMRAAGPDGTRYRLKSLPAILASSTRESSRTRLFPPNEPSLSWNVRSWISTAIAQDAPLSVRAAFRGKHVLLIGVTGFIGKVWLANTLMDLPEIGVHLSAHPAAEVESGAEALREDGRRVSGIRSALRASWAEAAAVHQPARCEWSKATSPNPDLGLDAEVAQSLCGRSLDLIINSSGLTDFNPDLRDALVHERGRGD